MEVRAEQQAIMLWNKTSGRTGYVNGAELQVLSDWVNHGCHGQQERQGQQQGHQRDQGRPHAFIEKLAQLDLLPKDPQALSDALVLCQQVQSPLNAWAAPESLHIELTSACPLKCPQCYKALDEQMLDFQFLQQLISQAAEMKVFQLAFGGGEPLLYPWLDEAILLATTHNMSSSITTSGATLTADKLQQLIQSGLNHIQVSLNGSSKEVHALSRNGFTLALRALTWLQQASTVSPFSYGINWVARKDNLHDWEALVKLAKQYQCNNINVLRYKPSQTENFETHSLNQDETYHLAEKIKKTKGIKINVDSAYANLLCHLNQRTGFMTGCGAGRRFMAVNVYGEFMPCSHVQMKTKADNLKDFWQNSPLLASFRHLEETVSAPCKTCSYLSGCRGCRAISERDQNFCAGDARCFLAQTSQAQQAPTA